MCEGNLHLVHQGQDLVLRVKENEEVNFSCVLLEGSIGGYCVNSVLLTSLLVERFK